MGKIHSQGNIVFACNIRIWGSGFGKKIQAVLFHATQAKIMQFDSIRCNEDYQPFGWLKENMKFIETKTFRHSKLDIISNHEDIKTTKHMS